MYLPGKEYLIYTVNDSQLTITTQKIIKLFQIVSTKCQFDDKQTPQFSHHQERVGNETQTCTTRKSKFAVVDTVKLEK